MDTARSNNMPNDNIERAIKREPETGKREPGRGYPEGYGPQLVWLFWWRHSPICNRTASDVRHVFSKHGGSLGESGCVAWMFEKKGRLAIDKQAAAVDEDALMLEAIENGAEDIEVDEEYIGIITAPGDFEAVKKALESSGYKFDDAAVTMIPTNTVGSPQDKSVQALRLLEALEDLDDIQEVYANGDIDEEALLEEPRGLVC